MKKFVALLVITSFLSLTLTGCAGETNPVDKNGKPRFVRISKEGAIGGVCAGVAYYFGVNLTIVRIGWVVAVLCGVGIISYVVCWVAVPDATYVPKDYHERAGKNKRVNQKDKFFCILSHWHCQWLSVLKPKTDIHFFVFLGKV